MVLLVDSSIIGYFTAFGRNEFLLRRMAKSPTSEYASHWSVMCGTWSCASLLCKVVFMAAQASRMAVGGWSVSLYWYLMNFCAW